MMIEHEYMKLGLAALFLVANFLGATFAIKRLFHARCAESSLPRIAPGSAAGHLGKTRL